MAADRGAFIDQSMSLNIHLKEPTMGKITSMHFAGWKMGLKTGMYYLRTMAASAPIQFTVDQEQLKVADKSVARDRSAPKKRASLGAPGSLRPMYVAKGGNGAAEKAHGMITPTATPPPSDSAEKQLVAKMTKTRLSEGMSSEEPSPKVLATEPTETPDLDESLEKPRSEAGRGW